MKEKFKSRKYILCITVLALGAIGLFTGFLTGAEFVSLCTLSLTIYSGSNVWNKKVEVDNNANR